jgi:hypothetical protein
MACQPYPVHALRLPELSMQGLGKLVGVIQIQINDRVLNVDIDRLRLGRRAPLQSMQNVPSAVTILN